MPTPEINYCLQDKNFSRSFEIVSVWVHKYEKSSAMHGVEANSLAIIAELVTELNHMLHKNPHQYHDYSKSYKKIIGQYLDSRDTKIAYMSHILAFGIQGLDEIEKKISGQPHDAENILDDIGKRELHNNLRLAYMLLKSLNDKVDSCLMLSICPPEAPLEGGFIASYQNFPPEHYLSQEDRLVRKYKKML